MQFVCNLAQVSFDTAASFNDLNKFEDALNVNICIISRKEGNKLVTGAPKDNRYQIFLETPKIHF